MPLGLPASVAAHITPDAATGCWLWTAGTCDKGYGRVRVHGRVWYTHRLVYTILVGPIPEGLELDHVRARGCKSVACCNPDHLEAVTHAENCRRGRAGEVNGERQRAVTHCPQGHEYTPENTYIYADKGRQCRACLRERQHVYYLRRKQRAAVPH